MSKSLLQLFDAKKTAAFIILNLIMVSYILLPISRSPLELFANICISMLAIMGSFILAYKITERKSASYACAAVYGLNPLLLSLLNLNIYSAIPYAAIVWLAIPLTLTRQQITLKIIYTFAVTAFLYAYFAAPATPAIMNSLGYKTAYLLPQDLMLTSEITKTLFSPIASHNSLAIGFYQLPIIFLIAGIIVLAVRGYTEFFALTATLVIISAKSITPPISPFVWLVPCTAIFCVTISIGYAKINPPRWLQIFYLTNIIICARLLAESYSF